MSDVNTAEGGTTLADLKTYINDPGNAFGFTASIVTNSDGTSSLQLASGTPGSAGTLAVSSNLTDSSTALGYASSVAGSNASLTVDGVNLTSASNTVSNLIAGVTFQLLSTNAAGSEVQVVIANDNSGVESAVNQFVTDYNSLISAINTQEGNDSSGNPEPLFGSPTLSLLQQELLSSINATNPNGTFDSIATNAGVTLSGSMTIQMSSGTAKTVMIGAAPSAADGGPAVDTIYTGSGSGSNTLAGLAAAINASNTPLQYSDAGYSSDTNEDSGTVGAVANAGDSLSGSLAIMVGTGAWSSVSMNDVQAAEGGATLSDLANYINSNSSTLGMTAETVTNSDGASSLSLESTTAGAGGALKVSSDLVDGFQGTAAIVTGNGESTLTLSSQTSGPSGAISVTSAINVTSPVALTFADSGYTSTTADSGMLGKAGATEALTGSVSVQVGGGSAQIIDMGTVASAEGGTTLSDVEQYISDNSSTLGFSAALVDNGDGSESLALTSNVNGSAGKLTVTSNLYNTANTTSSTLGYLNSSSINSLTSLGIGVNNDGSLTFDASSLDSLLNTDYSSVMGFFQNIDSWGQTFSRVLTSSGSSSSTGMLALAAKANSNIESTLNAEISKEEMYISTQQSSLTAE
ncbi:MAG: flagellar filament capping protein FliD, partial [Terracidiphilus sp.]